jgi:hypothetical protein
MSQNPYEPTISPKTSRESSGRNSPHRNHCPVCEAVISRSKLFLWPRVRCDQCSTELTLAAKHDSKPGLGCLALVISSIMIVLISSVCTLLYRVEMLGLMLLVIPAIGIYSMFVRWSDTFPYSKELVSLGRMPAPPTSSVDSSAESG